jgi:hypothetical protein
MLRRRTLDRLLCYWGHSHESEGHIASPSTRYCQGGWLARGGGDGLDGRLPFSGPRDRCPSDTHPDTNAYSRRDSYPDSRGNTHAISAGQH